MKEKDAIALAKKGKSLLNIECTPREKIKALAILERSWRILQSYGWSSDDFYKIGI